MERGAAASLSPSLSFSPRQQTRSSPRERAPRAISQPHSVPPSVSERHREIGVRTAIGTVKLGDRLDVKWVEGDGQFYTATVAAGESTALSPSPTHFIIQNLKSPCTEQLQRQA